MPGNKNPEAEQENKSDIVPKEELETLLKDKENLNRGIAKYRDESQTKSTRIKELEDKIAELSQVIPNEEAIDSLLEKKGYVRKDDLEKLENEKKAQELLNIKNTSINKFLEDNPEFNKDEMWNKFNEEFTNNYREQTTQQGWNRVFDKIKNNLGGSNLKEQGKVEAMIEQKEKSRLSLGGGSQGSSSTKEDNVESFMKQRPNLKATKEQLKQQEAELNALYPDKKE